MILQIIISNWILDLVTGILAKISLGTGIWAKFRLGTGIWYPPSRPSLVSEAIVWRFFQCLLQNDKGLLRSFPSLNRLTWKFKPFNKCFLSQNVTANFSLMLLQFCPCVWKARKASRLARKVKDVFRFVDHLFKYELYSPGLDSQKDF